MSSKVWLYQMQECYLAVVFFQDSPAGWSHEKGQQPSRAVIKILEESSVSNKISCMSRETMQSCHSDRS